MDIATTTRTIEKVPCDNNPALNPSPAKTNENSDACAKPNPTIKAIRMPYPATRVNADRIKGFIKNTVMRDNTRIARYCPCKKEESDICIPSITKNIVTNKSLTPFISV